ncbi:MAG TPA: hypothetical protein VF841_10925 [Anaeromyxobacter sp.]
MIVCPVCEHAQPQGGECEVCGKRLVEGSDGAAAVARLDGLEPTRAEGVEAPVEPIGALEPTAHAPARDAPAEPVLLERTRVDPVEVAVEPIPDVERIGDTIPEDARTEVPLFVTCRYCRAEAMPGERVCGRCGMRLPDFGGPAPAAEAAGRQCGCGAIVRGGGMCPSCGARR